jgi:pantothenate kinase type III
MVEGLIERLRAEAGRNADVVGTGGSLPLVTQFVDHADENLLLDGLRLLSQRL